MGLRYVGIGAAAIAGALFVLACGSGSDSAKSTPGKPCNANSDCASDQFCDSPGICGAGTCKTTPKSCSAMYVPVCGCNHVSASLDCVLQTTPSFPPSSVAYGGPCRAKPVRSCAVASDCGSDEVCAFDGSTTGTCLTAASAGKGITRCDDASCDLDDTQICATAACVGDAGASPCMYCVFSSAISCRASRDCPSGQICFSENGCTGNACARTCVVP